ncbi:MULTISPECIES: MarR family winged helix-turn-helix transcriptional regulator [unclassified Microbacterium]|uniref:MarR family winged helix-turn-helix transcriptional regulator n=1 Tax=unclassified Microbacterium TaxID=2609290 RepID=UPI000EA9CD1D|nr:MULTISPECIES: MarR family transcriptional regulator [unclassified Microbacterium]MBT2484721.1 MarR family transcriptional regulator [Microbacterium sp. ISL-108]RKN67605.1 MarR family transcriptional regulator [Microbacterium sp. CGR2]
MADAGDSRGWNPEELETWSAVATLLEWLPAVLDTQLRQDSEMSHFEFGILFALDQAEGNTLTMSELAGYANSSLSRLSRAVARLEKNGWAARRPKPDDGRITLATLTDEGAAAVRAALLGHTALVRRIVFGSLTDAQSRQLGAIARRITTAIDSQDAWAPPR